MGNNEYEKIFKKILENKELAEEMEKVSPGIKGAMAGYLMRSWLPSGMTRKIIMVIIALIAVVGGLYIQKLFFLLLSILPFFSPRISGEVLYFLGWISRK